MFNRYHYEAIPSAEWTATATIEELNNQMQAIEWHENNLKYATRLRPCEREDLRACERDRKTIAKELANRA